MRVEAPAEHPDAVGHARRDRAHVALGLTRGQRAPRSRCQRVVIGGVPPGHPGVDVRRGDRLPPPVAPERHPGELGGRRPLRLDRELNHSADQRIRDGGDHLADLGGGELGAMKRHNRRAKLGRRLLQLVLVPGPRDVPAQDERRAGLGGDQVDRDDHAEDLRPGREDGDMPDVVVEHRQHHVRSRLVGRDSDHGSAHCSRHGVIGGSPARDDLRAQVAVGDDAELTALELDKDRADLLGIHPARRVPERRLGFHDHRRPADQGARGLQATSGTGGAVPFPPARPPRVRRERARNRKLEGRPSSGTTSSAASA